MNLEIILQVLTAFGTIGATIAVIYFGAIQPRIQRAQFRISDTRVSGFNLPHEPRNTGQQRNHKEIGFFVEQIGGLPSRNVSVLVKKILMIEDDDTEVEWKAFIPSRLEWGVEGEIVFATGVQRYCKLGAYGDPPGNEFVGNTLYLAFVENTGDILFDPYSEILPGDTKYRFELLISGENVRAKTYCLAYDSETGLTLIP